MNGHCSTCDIEDLCYYKYKPCDCCNYRKFVENPTAPKLSTQLAKAKVEVANLPTQDTQTAVAPTWMTKDL